jgi:hypothetical protein
MARDTGRGATAYDRARQNLDRHPATFSLPKWPPAGEHALGHPEPRTLPS